LGLAAFQGGIMLGYIVSSSLLFSGYLLVAAPLRTLEPQNGSTSADGRPPPVAPQSSAKRAAKGQPVIIEGRDYRSLDEYLAKLEQDGWVGKPWYKEVRPGLYELVTNLKPAPEKRLFTRAELERQFGFAR
jgi:hypothetical protein